MAVEISFAAFKKVFDGNFDAAVNAKDEPIAKSAFSAFDGALDGVKDGKISAADFSQDKIAASAKAQGVSEGALRRAISDNLLAAALECTQGSDVRQNFIALATKVGNVTEAQLLQREPLVAAETRLSFEADRHSRFPATTLSDATTTAQVVTDNLSKLSAFVSTHPADAPVLLSLYTKTLGFAMQGMLGTVADAANGALTLKAQADLQLQLSEAIFQSIKSTNYFVIDHIEVPKPDEISEFLKEVNQGKDKQAVPMLEQALFLLNFMVEKGPAANKAETQKCLDAVRQTIANKVGPMSQHFAALLEFEKGLTAHLRSK